MLAFGRVKWPFSIAAVLLSAVSLVAQTEDCLHRKVPVSLIKGTPGPARIEPDRLRATIRGKPVKIRGISYNKDMRKAVIVLDSSGSMMGEGNRTKGEWSVATGIVRHIVRWSPDDLQLAFLGFSSTRNDLINFAPGSRAEILLHMDSYGDPKGTTPLWDTIRKMMDNKDLGQIDSIFLISDGEDTSSNEDRDRLIRRLSASKIRVNSILLKGPPTYSEINLNGAENLAELSKQTGGWAYWVDTGKKVDLQKVDQSVEAELRGLLRLRPSQLEIELNQNTKKWTKMDLVYLDEKGKPDKQMDVIYPHLLAPCSADQTSGK